jgi:hypothetical protein
MTKTAEASPGKYRSIRESHKRPHPEEAPRAVSKDEGAQIGVKKKRNDTRPDALVLRDAGVARSSG